MQEQDTDVYVKFNRKNQRNVIGSFRVSSDIEEIRKQKGHKKGTGKPTSTTSDGTSIKPFTKLGKNLIGKIDVFRRTVPFLMGVMPMMIDIDSDKKLRKYVSEKGRLVESIEDEDIYSVSFHDFRIISRNIKEISSISRGISQIPDLFLIGLISSYDSFFGDLMRDFLLSRPEIISTSERNISLKDLVELGSIEAARERLVEKEIDSTLRGSHLDQIIWLESKANVKIRDKNPLWGKFIEICERRNLFTHTNGIVSYQYLSVCKQNGVDTELKVGDRVMIDSKYFKESASLVLEFGIKLYQLIWRKILPTELEKAEIDYSNICYDFLVDRDFSMVSRLASFALDTPIKFHKESIRRMLIVNRAIAEKELGNSAEAIKIIENEDWSAVGDEYKICIHAIKDEDSEVLSMMKRVAASESVDAESFRTWPAFNKLRENKDFSEKFKEIFDEDLVPSQRIVSEEDTDHKQNDGKALSITNNEVNPIPTSE